jgi:hypothetical protein
MTLALFPVQASSKKGGCEGDSDRHTLATLLQHINTTTVRRFVFECVAFTPSPSPGALPPCAILVVEFVKESELEKNPAAWFYRVQLFVKR